MNRLINNAVRVVRAPFARKWILATAAAMTLGGGLIPASAMADRYDRYDDHRGGRVGVDIRIGDRDRCEPRYEERVTKVWVAPVYRTECERKFIEPVYRIVCDKHWVEPVYRTVCEKVWIPDRYDTREVRYFDGHCYRTRCDRVLVCAGHFEEVRRQVCVSEGRFETVERRECVAEGRWEECKREVLVAEGHFEVRSERVRVADRRDGFDVVNPLLAGLNVQIRR